MLELLILATLFIEPCHGYEIKKNHPGLKINNNQLYPLLKKFVEAGFVSSDIQEQDKKPSKTVYTLTDKGRERLFELLGEYNEDERKYDDSFYLRVAFFQFLPKETIRHILDTRESYLEALESQKDLMKLLEKFPDRDYDILYLKNYFNSKLFNEKLFINSLRAKYDIESQ